MERSRAGDLDTAAELFRQASDRGHALAACALAALLKDRGQLSEAETHYRRALASGLPADSPQLIADCEASLGYIRAQMGDDVDAERFYRAADARGHLDATFNLGNLLSRTGRAPEAEQVWRRAAAAGQADAAYNLAELVAERGDLEEAERLLRQAMAAGITDAINNLAKIRLRRGDPVEAESLLRRGVAAGDHNAVFNLGIVLKVLGKLDEAEAMLRHAAAVGHPEALGELDRLGAARRPAEPIGAGNLSAEPDPAPSNSTVDRGAPDVLDVLFAKDSSKADRMRAMRAFGTVANARLSAAVSTAEQGRDVLAESSAQLLSEVAARLPIRTADTLRRQYGADPETQSQQVITSAGRLAGLLWTAAAAVPGPPPVVRAIKTVIHSAIEIRMIGELYAIHGDGTDRDATWLSTVLLSWASGQPVAPGGSVAATTAALVTKIRGSASKLIGSHSRAATVASRGREGADSVRRTGARMHRRMRLHPSSWVQPGTDSMGMVVRGMAGQVVADKIGGRVPQALLSAARDHLIPSAALTAAEEPAAPTIFAGPREALTQAWALHQHAVATAPATSTSDVATTRLGAALAAQERHLTDLGRRLGYARAPVPAQRGGAVSGGAVSGDAISGGAVSGDVGRLVWQAEDAIDAVEETGARSRRLPSWSTRRRAALVYLTTALAMSALPAVALLGSSDFGMVGLLLVQCLALPWLSLVAGAIAIGPLFRPWLRGPVPRHPVIGTGIVIGVHVGLGALVTALGVLL